MSSRAWAARVAPFLDAGHDVYAFFRHDETGNAARLAARLADEVDGVLAAGAAPGVTPQAPV